MMNIHTSSRALHVLSVSPVESPLSSKVHVWLVGVNLAVAVIKICGWLLPNNRRKTQFAICIATLSACIPMVCLVALKGVDGMYLTSIRIT